VLPEQSSKQQPKGKKPSKTLSRITGAVKKTDPDEVQRQWEAREDARKRAMLANLSFGVDAATMSPMQGLPRPPTSLNAAKAKDDVSEGILNRNKAFADALGVTPATVRNHFNSGWARPTDGTNIDLDEFGNELNAPIYTESLLAQARERTGLLLKLEKKWKTFLADDSAASLPLNPMDRPSRAFVHHYSDFWKLRTESFDAEPKRYIHCVKLLDTQMPNPLLSDVARNWRGPLHSVITTTTKLSDDHTFQQVAGQTTKSREMPPPPDRVPLPIRPRTLPPGEQKAGPMPTAAGLLQSADESNARFGSLFTGRERPKLDLVKRTVPLEIPPFQPEKGFNIAEDIQKSQAKRDEHARKKREAEEKKKRALEDAFASDDDEQGAVQSSESDWEESEPLYTGSSDNEE
jgi:hypothetical protein